MALTQAALFVGSRDGYVVDALIVDHGLREESAREAQHVAGVQHSETVFVEFQPAVTAFQDISFRTRRNPCDTG